MKYLVIYDNTNHFFEEFETAKAVFEANGGLFLEEKAPNVYEAVTT
jgi:hypothetical protein